MKRALVFSFFILMNFNTIAQVYIDSLKAIANNEMQLDTIRLNAFYQILEDRSWRTANNDSFIYYADQMAILANKIGDREYQMKSMLVKAKLKLINRQYSDAINFANQSLDIAKEINSNIGFSDANSVFAMIAYNAGDMKKLLYYQKQALDYINKTKDQKRIAWQLHNLGYAYQENEDYNNAIKYYKESLDLSRKYKLPETQANCLAYLGESYLLLGEYQKAQFHFREALIIKDSSNQTFELAWTLAKMGEGYIAMKNFREAIEVCNKAYYTVNVDKNTKSVACNCLYISHKNLGRHQKALQYLEEWNELVEISKKKETSVLLEQNDFKNQLVIDSIQQVEKLRLVQLSHMEKLRKQEKIRNISFGAGGIILLLAFGLYRRNRFIQKSKETLQLEKDRSESLLLNILPAQIAEELKIKGSADAKDFELVSILFTDFKGFTNISEKLTAKELVSEINHCFKAFDNICEKYQIEKIKTIGDAYMAAGGLPAPTENSVKNTVQAAIEMSEFIKQRKKEREEEGKLPFEMRVGIHTGHVVAGIVGVKKFQYDVWGDTVNTASRLESKGMPGKVNISETTYNLLKNDPDLIFESRGKIQVKGKGELEMYFVDKSAA